MVSFLFFNRRIFSLWVKIIIIKKVKKIKSGTILSEKKANKKTFNEPKIEAKDEYLDRKKIIIQDNPKTRLKLKDKAKTIPK